jgi:hypothetical protein
MPAIRQLTPADMAPLMARLDALGLIKITSPAQYRAVELAKVPGPGEPGADHYTIPEVAKYVQFEVRDVYSWIRVGKVGNDGSRIHLATLAFWPGGYLVPWGAVLAYGTGISFEKWQRLAGSGDLMVVTSTANPEGQEPFEWLRKPRKRKGRNSAEVLHVAK